MSLPIVERNQLTLREPNQKMADRIKQLKWYKTNLFNNCPSGRTGGAACLKMFLLIYFNVRGESVKDILEHVLPALINYNEKLKVTLCFYS